MVYLKVLSYRRTDLNQCLVLGNVGATFGTTIPQSNLIKYWRNIQMTLQEMITSCMARRGVWLEFTISATDQDYLIYKIGAQVGGNGDGNILLRETLVQGGRRVSSQKMLPNIRVKQWITYPSDFNVVINVIGRRYGILLVNSRTAINFNIDERTGGSGSLPGFDKQPLINAKAPKTTITMSQNSIKLSLAECMAKLLNNNTSASEFTINATDENYLRYTLNVQKDLNKNGVIVITEEVIRNGVKKSTTKLTRQIKLVKGKYDIAAFTSILSYIINKYQALINTVRYNTAQ
jgi:hypothetical protein